MKHPVSLFVVWALAAGLVAAQEGAPTVEVTGGDDLVKGQGRFEETWVHPDADMGRYGKLYLWQAEFHFRDVGEARSAGSTTRTLRDGGQFAIREEDRKRFQQVVTAAIEEELGRSKLFQVVDRPGPGTLIVRPLVLDVVSNVPPKLAGTADIYLSAVGEATILFELIDAETGVIQARAGERQRIQPPSRTFEVNTLPANAATVWADVERWARKVAVDLRQALDRARKRAGG